MYRGVLQYNPEDCGTACLVTIFKHHGIVVPVIDVKRKLAYGKEGASLLSLVRVAGEYGLEAVSYKGNSDELIKDIEQEKIKLPIIAHVNLENGDGHYIIVNKITQAKKFKVFDPASGNKVLKLEEFDNIWTGYIVSFQKKENFKKIKIPNRKYRLFSKELLAQKFLIIKVLCSSICIIGISYLGTIFIKIVFDKFILKSQKISSVEEFFGVVSNNVLPLAFFVIFLYLLRMFISIAKGIFTSKIALAMNIKFSSLFYSKLLNIKSEFFDRIETGEITARFHSIMDLQYLLINSTMTLIIESVSSIIGGVVLFLISPQLFLIVISMIICYAIVVILFIPKLKLLNKRFYTKYSEELTLLSQTLRGIDTIKINNSKEWFENKFSAPVKDAAAYKFKEEKYGSVLISTVTFIESFGFLVLLVLGARLVTDEKISLGTFVAFQSIMTFFVEPLKQLIILQDEFQNISVVINRLNDVYGEPSEVVENDRHLSDLKSNDFNIKLKDVSYRTGHELPIIEKINLSIKSGEHVGIIGANGSGKSTLLKLFSTINYVSTGTYFIGEHSVDKYPLDYIRTYISYVEQEPFIFSGSILENLLLGNNDKIDEKNLEQVCKICGIYEINGQENSGLNLMLSENGANISGGEKQKIGLARAILRKPKILILDESTSNIDSMTELKIFDFIRNQYKDTTVIIVSHKRSIAYFTDYLVVLSNRTIESIGSADYLLKNSKTYQDIIKTSEAML